jgi:hypothetical protein
MKKLIFGIIIVGMYLLTGTTQVMAGTGENVQVVVVPYLGGGITSFNATILSDTEVYLEWTILDGTANVMVRAKYGSMPMDRTDGYLVYYGSDLSVSDTSMDFNENISIIYYRIWAETSESVWLDSEVTTVETEGIYMFLLALFILAAAVSYLSFYNSFPLLKLGASGAWIVLFIYCKDNLTNVIDEGSGAHTAILLVIALMALAVPLAGLGRDIQRQKQMRIGNSNNNFAFSEFKWKFGKDRNEMDETYIMPHRETAEEYRDKVHRALRRK